MHATLHAHEAVVAMLEEPTDLAAASSMASSSATSMFHDRVTHRELPLPHQGRSSRFASLLTHCGLLGSSLLAEQEPSGLAVQEGGESHCGLDETGHWSGRASDSRAADKAGLMDSALGDSSSGNTSSNSSSSSGLHGLSSNNELIALRWLKKLQQQVEQRELERSSSSRGFSFSGLNERLYHGCSWHSFNSNFAS